jgi:hypothetical protein
MLVGRCGAQQQATQPTRNLFLLPAALHQKAPR